MHYAYIAQYEIYILILKVNLTYNCMLISILYLYYYYYIYLHYYYDYYYIYYDVTAHRAIIREGLSPLSGRERIHPAIRCSFFSAAFFRNCMLFCNFEGTLLRGVGRSCRQSENIV